MVETQESLDNLEAILTTPGLDGVFVGPGYLRLSLTGKTRMDLNDPILLEALERIVNVARENGRVAGIWVPDASSGQKMSQLGYQLITISTDTRMLTAAARDIVSQFKS